VKSASAGESTTVGLARAEPVGERRSTPMSREAIEFERRSAGCCPEELSADFPPASGGDSSAVLRLEMETDGLLARRG
jgi:hypothetical protein